ncbi:iron transporter [Propylenella binzhouense]|uniref:Fe2+ transport protein n=1 Tax=Propylenella binzhouense TaxID=2555902 RepID=A0A964WSE6_9HYPH|nr:iron transporter [Propylenella binzhouense]MYZ46882.1 hypothetical protein [Propylenella binzhouense]
MNDRSPAMKPSEEADRRGLELGCRQGKALGDTLEHMIGKIAESGAETRSDEYLVGYAVEEAEGMYHRKNGELRWIEPDEENVHIEALVRDAADGRFIPGLRVSVTVKAESGEEIGTHEHPLLWHPYLYHYGRNWKVPGEGKYDLTIRFDAPDFPRHDKKNGKRFVDGAEVTFKGVEIKTGAK